jgi:putative membrane protein insertion efficiency factor
MKKIPLFLLKNYKNILSPFLYKIIGHGCRYTPTCSEYSQEAIKIYGLKKGMVLTVKRFINCHPFSNRPFLDPVPKAVN